MTILWLRFGLSALIVIAAGVTLARTAEVIAEKGRLGGVWVGSILLAGATSLPEVVTSISSGYFGFPDIAVGNVFGSNIFNIFIIAVADLFDGRGSILRKTSPTHIITALFGMLLSGMAAVGILTGLSIGVGGVGVDSIFIGIVYWLGMRMISRYEQRPPADQAQLIVDADDEERARKRKFAAGSDATMSLPVAYGAFFTAALATVVAGVVLSKAGDELATVTGLGGTFVGSTFIAAVTSLPEVVTTMSAVMAGAFDLAVGNVLGSNMFNMIILLLGDVAFRGGPILSAVSESHALVSLFGLIMSGIVVMGLFYRSRRSYAGLGPDSVAIFITYGIALALLYTLR